MGSDAGTYTRTTYHRVNGAGQRHLRVIMHPSGHACGMQASPAMNLSPVNSRRVVLGSAGAKKLP